jgi:uncharacterized NAD(P)/FAD-binding protein YdhS
MTRHTIAVVGAGFSGTLLALHLLRRCPPRTRVILVERNAHFGRGTAYSTGNSSHLLNVPASKMSAFQSQPDDFLNWLRSRPASDLQGVDPTPATFVPRGLFGHYIRYLLDLEMTSEPRGARLELVRGDVTDITSLDGIVTLRLDCARVITVDRAILAVGNFPPSPPVIADPSFYDSPLYKPDPWAPRLLADLDADEPVMLIGTGLTMVDTVISLLDRGHRGPITALSRRGLLPHAHLAGSVGGGLPEINCFPTHLNSLTRFVRNRACGSMAAGGTWQAVIDELRPITVEMWQMMGANDRKRFLRHLRPWWDTHRHRVSGPVAARIAAARDSGHLQIRAGRIRGYTRVADDKVAVTFRPRHKSHEESLHVGMVVNCAGPETDFARIQDPLVLTLLQKGLVRPDPLCLGLDVTNTGALLERGGAISRRLFAVGPITKGAFWEMTAVPDIRQQAELLAGHIATLIKPAATAHEPDMLPLMGKNLVGGGAATWGYSI